MLGFPAPVSKAVPPSANDEDSRLAFPCFEILLPLVPVKPPPPFYDALVVVLRHADECQMHSRAARSFLEADHEN